MAKVMIRIYILLLLAVYITATATATKSSRRTYPPNRHHRGWGSVNSSIRPTSRHHGEWSTNSSIRATSSHHGESTAVHSSIRPTSSHHGESTAVHSNIRPTSRHHEEWSTTISRIRTISKHHREGGKGLVLYPYMHNKHNSYGRSIRQDWEGNTMSVKDCPSVCYCAFRKYSFRFVWYQGLLVKDCTSNPIGELPKLFNSYGDKLQILELNSCLLSRLPEDIRKLRVLFGLYLIKNNFTELPHQLQQLPMLEELVIQANKAEHINLDNVTNLSNLTFLILSQNRIAALPHEIGTMRSLLFLNVSHNQIQSLPEGIWALTQLLILDLSNNEIQSLSDRVGALTQLGALFLNNNEIKSLPEGTWALTQLQVLWLDYNEIQSLSEGIGALTQLYVLTIKYNQLETLPYELGNLTTLEDLEIQHNQIKIVPSSIGALTQLKNLDLTGNKIQTVPGEIKKLNKLETLNLEGNLLTEVPPVPTERLLYLYLGINTIRTIPCEIFTENRLEELELQYNDLQSFNCVDHINLYMTYLNLSHNALEKMPCQYTMSSLVKLDISYNHISTLPEGCTPFVLSRIEWLSLSFNKISALHFQQFCSSESSFQFISFRNNMIRTIDTIEITESDLLECFQPGAVIDLANNRISTLDSWPLLLAERKIITLNVRGNNLSEFRNYAKSFLPTFKPGSTFHLQQNQVRHFMDVFDGWKIVVNTTENLNTLLKNTYFDLAGNPLVCDCIDYEVYRYIQTLRTELYDNLVCHEPLSLRGKNPHYIPLGNFVCDVYLNCPNGCTCIKVPHSHSINVICGSYIHTDIPEIIPDVPNENYGYRLDICNQNLREITYRPYLQKSTEIMLSNNSILVIKINSSNAFHRVRILHLDNNSLQRLPESVAGLTNETAVEVRLGSNPWVCDCEVIAMKNWIMLNFHIVKDKDIVLCHSPPRMVGVKVKDIERSLVCPNENMTAVYVVVVISSIVLILVVYLAITDSLKYTNWRLVGSDECDGECKEFDVFMCSCSADADSEYVENYVIPELERRDFRVCYHREHFHGGKPIHVNMSEAIEKSKRTLAFFSNNFRMSGYSMFEFHSAHDLDIQNKTRRLITIKDTDLDMSKLDISEVHYFRTHTYIRREDEKFWKLLECTLPRKRLGAQVR